MTAPTVPLRTVCDTVRRIAKERPSYVAPTTGPCETGYMRRGEPNDLIAHALHEHGLLPADLEGFWRFNTALVHDLLPHLGYVLHPKDRDLVRWLEWIQYHEDRATTWRLCVELADRLIAQGRVAS